MRLEETLARASKAPATAFDFSGEWTNEMASTMDIIQEGGVITGVYTCQINNSERGEIGQLSGYAHGSLISFVVKWNSMAITSWVGRHTVKAGEDVIDTLWQMTSLSDDADAGLWHSINTGADRFTRPMVRQDAEPLFTRGAGEVVDVPAL